MQPRPHRVLPPTRPTRQAHTLRSPLPTPWPLWLGLLLALALALPALGSTGQPSPPTQPFGDVIDVRIVEVEAVVTGKNGERLHGLEASDFRLSVDGREVPIRYFEEVTGQAAAGKSGALPMARGGNDGHGAPAVGARNYLVFVDDTFTQRGRRHRLLQNLADEVRALQPGERMAVVRYAGRSLEVVSDWTDSRDQLLRSLETVRRSTPSELIRRARTAGAAHPVLDARIRADQITDALDAMGAAMRSLSGVEGRKLFLPVSAGWEYDPTLRVSDAIGRADASGRGFQDGPDSFQVGDLPTLSDVTRYLNAGLLLPVTDTANLLGYTIYPLHVGDGRNNVRWSSLWSVARETGGVMAAVEGFAPRPLEEVREDTRSYYVLAFSPDWEWNDQRHEVEVEVTRQDAKVRHRKSFLDLSRDTQRALQVEEALLVNLAPGETPGDSPILEVHLGQAEPVKRSVVEVPVELEIPMDWVTAVPRGDSWSTSLELRVAALDARGQRSEMPVIPVTLSGEGEIGRDDGQGGQEGDGIAVYETRVRLRNAPQRLVLSLTDTLSGEARVAAVDFVP